MDRNIEDDKSVLEQIHKKYPDITVEDLAKSFETYGRMFHFININFHMHLTRGCKFLCDIHDVKEYDEYIRFLDASGIEHRI